MSYNMVAPNDSSAEEVVEMVGTAALLLDVGEMSVALLSILLHLVVLPFLEVRGEISFWNQ